MPNDTINKDTVNSSEISMAKTDVKFSLEKFESALDTLADKIEFTSQRIQKPLRVAREWKNAVIELKDTAMANPYAKEAIAFSSLLLTRVRRNPRPFGIAALGIIGVVALIAYSRRRSHTSALRA